MRPAKFASGFLRLAVATALPFSSVLITPHSLDSQALAQEPPLPNREEEESPATNPAPPQRMPSPPASYPPAGTPPPLVEQGTLEKGDKIMNSDGSLYDIYPIQGRAGQALTVVVESQDFDTFLAVIDAESNILEENDDISDGNTNSTLTITLPNDGIYYVIVNAYEPNGSGQYTLTVRE